MKGSERSASIKLVATICFMPLLNSSFIYLVYTFVWVLKIPSLLPKLWISSLNLLSFIRCASFSYINTYIMNCVRLELELGALLVRHKNHVAQYQAQSPFNLAYICE